MEPLEVDIVHFYPRENSQAHHTQKFEVVNDEPAVTTIVRRGTPFNGAVRFTRPYDEENDQVQLVFNLGDKPQYETQGSVFLRRDVVSDKHLWSAKLLDVQGDTLSFEVVGPDATALPSHGEHFRKPSLADKGMHPIKYRIY